jgi:hypothetical protein
MKSKLVHNLKLFHSVVCVMLLLAALISCSSKGEESSSGENASGVIYNTDAPENGHTTGLKGQVSAAPVSGMPAGPGRLYLQDRPGEIRRWVSILQELHRSPLWHARAYGDSLYIYVGWGEKPTGGYSVEITDVERSGNGELVVKTLFRAPAPDEMVTQVITYPYDLIAVDKTDADIRIEPRGDDAPRLILTIIGVDPVRPIVDGSRSIKLFEPEPGKNVSSGFRVSGIASVFEGTVNYRVLNEAEEVIRESFTTAADGMNWGYFSFEPDIREKAGDGEQISLELFSIDAKDGEEINKFRIPLIYDES